MAMSQPTRRVIRDVPASTRPPPPRSAAPRSGPAPQKGAAPSAAAPAPLNKQQLEKFRNKIAHERIAELARAAALDIGDPTFIAKVEQALIERHIVKLRGKGGPPRPRRVTTYVSEELGAKLYQRAKREQRDPNQVVADALEAYLKTETPKHPLAEDILLDAGPLPPLSER